MCAVDRETPSLRRKLGAGVYSWIESVHSRNATICVITIIVKSFISMFPWFSASDFVHPSWHEMRTHLPHFVATVSSPIRSTQSDGSRPGPHRSHRENIHGTEPGRANKGRSEISAHPRRRAAS